MSAGRSWVIGLTGGIGTGKTRVAQLLRELGAAVECSDQIVRELQARGGRALPAIVDAFGQHYITAQGDLDRDRLGQRVFSNPAALQRLNRIVHPLVGEELSRRLASHIASGVPVIVLDIPLLLESRMAGRGSGAELPFDQIVLVYAPEAVQAERASLRDSMSIDDVRKRIRAQLSIEEKRKQADVVIDNSEDWENTEAQVRALYQGWLEQAPPSRT